VATIALVASLITAAGPAAPASALLGGLLGTVTGLVGGLLGVVTSGWDEGVTTPPVTMRTVAAAIGADDMWARGYDGSGIGVAVIDTGVAPVQGLSTTGKVVNGPDLSFESQVDELRYLDGYGHGTHMAGIIAGNDGVIGGFKGIAPGARLLNMRVGAGDGGVDVTQVIAAIDWVVQHRTDGGLNVRVINLSFGTDGMQAEQLDPLAFAVEAAWRNGVVVVVGAGNDGTARPALTNPATNPFVIAVGAADLNATATVADDKVAPFSSRGSAARSADFVAPGVSIASLRDPGSAIDTAHPGAVVEDRFFRGSGTSQAAAVTSGAVALLLQARPNLTPDQVKALLRSTSTPIVGADFRSQGAGRLEVSLAGLGIVPRGATQQWAKGTGTGTVEGARGTSHVADEGVELVGEFDIFGRAWVGATWAPTALAGTSWAAGTWNGSVWTGTCWCAASWSGTSWTGSRWIGESWNGSRWIDQSWTGSRWIGSRWIGSRWIGSRWIGQSWTGSAWGGK
jgi:serine protease AprX